MDRLLHGRQEGETETLVPLLVPSDSLCEFGYGLGSELDP
jgi:hypothetical protein